MAMTCLSARGQQEGWAQLSPHWLLFPVPLVCLFKGFKEIFFTKQHIC